MNDSDFIVATSVFLFITSPNFVYFISSNNPGYAVIALSPGMSPYLRVVKRIPAITTTRSCLAGATHKQKLTEIDLSKKSFHAIPVHFFTCKKTGKNSSA